MTLKSQWPGTCKLDKSHIWKVGDPIWYDKATKSACIHEECYKKQMSSQGTLANATEPPKPVSQDRFTQAVIQSNLAWDYAVKKANEIMNGKVQNERDIMILTQVLYKGMIQLMEP